MKLAMQRDVLAALRTVIQLPQSLVSLKLTMSIDEPPALECTFHPEIEVTSLESTAREFRIGDTAATRRYKLVEIVDEVSPE